MRLISVEEFDETIIKEIGERLLKGTVQIFRRNSEEGIVSHGSGILFYVQEHFFMITAAHNFFNEDLSELQIRANNKLIDLSGNKVYSRNPNSDEVDKIDIGVVKLEGELLDELKKSNHFIEIIDVELNSKQKFWNNPENRESDYYFLLGFPGKKTKLKYRSNTDWKVKVLYIVGFLNKKNQKKIMIEGYGQHLFINKFHKYKELGTNQKKEVPKLKGMSGCGLWDIKGYDLEKQKPIVKLVGILIEQNHGVLISTKIDFAIEMIRQVFGVVKLPKSVIDITWEGIQ